MPAISPLFEPGRIPELKVRIAGVGSYVPERRLTNEEIASVVDVDPNWVRDKLGIQERRIAAEQELTSDMALSAARSALSVAGLDPSDVGLVVLATTTPDRQAPATACRVTQGLGIPEVPAFDLSAVCSGFLYALTTAAHCLQGGLRDTALVIGADAFSRITNWKSRDCVFFGDGAGAVILERSAADAAFFLSSLGADATGYDYFTIYPGDQHFSMDAKGVYCSAKEMVSGLAKRTLERAGLHPTDIDHVIPHQPSITLLKAISREVGVSFNKFWLHMDRYANTAAGTIPIALEDARRSGELKHGDWMLFAAAGAGMTSGVALYRWH